MKRAGLLLIIAPALPLVGCQSLTEVAERECSSQFHTGSAAYADCARREFQSQYRFLEEEQNRRREEERHATGG